MRGNCPAGSASERHVQKALERLRRGRTTFVIAHRMSTVREVDPELMFAAGVRLQAEQRVP